MEERIIDDEYGRGVRLRKTKNGYVDVTDEMIDEENAEFLEDGEGEEVEFEFPVFADEDDEELATLTAEEAQELIRRREEEEKQRQQDYAAACAEGEELLATGSFHAAELKFERALQLDEIATQATVGYWRAKTENFANPDALISEYTQEGMAGVEHDLGIEAVRILISEHQEAFKKRCAELEEEIQPLQKTVEEKRENRHAILHERVKRSSLVAILWAIPTVVFCILAIVFGLKNFSTRGNEFVVWTIVFGALFLILLFVEADTANKAINDVRMYKANQRLNSTEEGQHLKTLLEHQALYREFIVK